MSKAADKAKAGMLAGMQAGHLQAKIDRKVEAEQKRARSVSLFDLAAIQPRNTDSRPARAAHVLALAESIGAVGLVQPLAVDRHGRLIAGLHRLEACRLLNTPPPMRTERLAALGDADKLPMPETTERLRALPVKLPEPMAGGKLPCRVLDLDAEKDEAGALAAEAAENTARRNYTPAEVEALAQRLRKAGYKETTGRPGKNTKALRPALELVLGVSTSTARRMLGRVEAGKVVQMNTFSGMLESLQKGLKRITAADLPHGERLPALRTAQAMARQLLDVLPAALADAETLKERE